MSKTACASERETVKAVAGATLSVAAAYPIVFSAMFVLQFGYYTLVWRRRPLRRMV
ncbi:hypothetical protein [Bradyrhizobium sp. AZCC 1693]|uniref:hypothetical protein n=1 Tax=Bradyrhizobium sp. AZCC 1693 TaxID=3117029 RepID=UPI002FF308EC